MKTIKVKLSESGIDALIKQLEEYSNKIETRTHELAKKLAEDGAAVVQRNYDISKEQYGSHGDHTIEVEQGNKETTLRASGPHVAFYEYGTGLYAGDEYPADYIPQGLDVSPGSWSRSDKGKGQFDYINKPYWEYEQMTYGGFPPSFGMYEASKTIRRNVEKRAREIFK